MFFTGSPSFIKALLIILKRAALLCQLAFEVHHLDLQLTNPLHLALELVEESGDLNLLGLLHSRKRLHGLLLGLVLSLNLLNGLIFNACQHADHLSRRGWLQLVGAAWCPNDSLEAKDVPSYHARVGCAPIALQDLVLAVAIVEVAVVVVVVVVAVVVVCWQDRTARSAK